MLSFRVPKYPVGRTMCRRVVISCIVQNIFMPEQIAQTVYVDSKHKSRNT